MQRGGKAYVPGFIREVVVDRNRGRQIREVVEVVDGEGNRGRRGRHEVDRCKRNTVSHTPRPVPRVDGVDTPHTCSDVSGLCTPGRAFCTCFANVHDSFPRRRIVDWRRRAAPSCV